MTLVFEILVLNTNASTLNRNEKKKHIGQRQGDYYRYLALTDCKYALLSTRQDFLSYCFVLYNTNRRPSLRSSFILPVPHFIFRLSCQFLHYVCQFVSRFFYPPTSMTIRLFVHQTFF